jgi:hypothetical protein
MSPKRAWPGVVNKWWLPLRRKASMNEQFLRGVWGVSERIREYLSVQEKMKTRLSARAALAD